MIKDQNETVEVFYEEVADLPVSDEQAEQAKGGDLTMNYNKITWKYQEQDHK